MSLWGNSNKSKTNALEDKKDQKTTIPDDNLDIMLINWISSNVKQYIESIEKNIITKISEMINSNEIVEYHTINIPNTYTRNSMVIGQIQKKINDINEKYKYIEVRLQHINSNGYVQRCSSNSNESTHEVRIRVDIKSLLNDVCEKDKERDDVNNEVMKNVVIIQ